MPPRRARSVRATGRGRAPGPVDEPAAGASASIEALGQLVRQQERLIEELVRERTAAMSGMHIPREPPGHFTPAEQTGGGSAWSLNRFMQLSPPLFSGTTDPMEANRWMVDVRKILTAFECPESRQVTFATFLLRGEAEEWWRATECLMPDRLAGEYITWRAF